MIGDVIVSILRAGTGKCGGAIGSVEWAAWADVESAP